GEVSKSASSVPQACVDCTPRPETTRTRAPARTRVEAFQMFSVMKHLPGDGDVPTGGAVPRECDQHPGRFPPFPFPFPFPYTDRERERVRERDPWPPISPVRVELSRQRLAAPLAHHGDHHPQERDPYDPRAEHDREHHDRADGIATRAA